MAFNQQNNTGFFLPSTYIFDVASIREIDVNKPEFKELLVRLYQNINNICIAVNSKDTGLYFLNEFVTGKRLFPNANLMNSSASGRPIFRQVINFGPLPNTTTISIPHNIDMTNSTSIIDIYGGASDQINLSYIPLPYSSASAVANNIELYADAINVYITTGADQSAYMTSTIILEYVKQ